jgi:hypothetical protein
MDHPKCAERNRVGFASWFGCIGPSGKILRWRLSDGAYVVQNESAKKGALRPAVYHRRIVGCMRPELGEFIQ